MSISYHVWWYTIPRPRDLWCILPHTLHSRASLFVCVVEHSLSSPRVVYRYVRDLQSTPVCSSTVFHTSSTLSFRNSSFNSTALLLKRGAALVLIGSFCLMSLSLFLTATNPNMSTKIPDPALDINVPAPEREYHNPATSPWVAGESGYHA